MKLLYVDACLRGPELSRTSRLCEAFLQEAEKAVPNLTVVRCDLSRERLLPMDAALLPLRDRVCDDRDWDQPIVQPAVRLAQADAVLIGAPYWDLMFPAALKIWVENVFVRNLTFRYTEAGEPMGLAHAKKCVYVTTSGSPIGANDWGYGYMQAALGMLGVSGFERISAEGIDIRGWDAAGILARAEEEARAAGRRLAGLAQNG